MIGVVILVARILFVIACPQAQEMMVSVEHVDATGQAPAAVQSGGSTTQQATPPSASTPDDSGTNNLHLSPQTITDLIWCLNLGICPSPNRELDWGIVR